MGTVPLARRWRLEMVFGVSEEERARKSSKSGWAPLPVECECVQRLFERQAALRPDAVALQADEDCWSYSKLDRYSNFLAVQLRNCAVEPNSFVAVCVRRSPEAIAAFLGVLKAGAAYLPLDLNYPAERLRYMLDDADVRCIIGTAREFRH